MTDQKITQRMLRQGADDELDGCTEGSSEETEFVLILDAIGAYEAKRWPLGKIPGGKG